MVLGGGFVAYVASTTTMKSPCEGNFFKSEDFDEDFVEDEPLPDHDDDNLRGSKEDFDADFVEDEPIPGHENENLRGSKQVIVSVAHSESEEARGPALPGPMISGPPDGTTKQMLSELRALSVDLTPGSKCSTWYGIEMIEKQRQKILEVCEPIADSDSVPSKVYCYSRDPFDLGTRYTCVFEDAELVDYRPEFWKKPTSAIHYTKLAVQSCTMGVNVMKISWDGWTEYTMRHVEERPRLECRDVVEHPVIVYTMWELAGHNLYEQMGDYFTVLEAVLTMQVEFSDVELFLTNIDNKMPAYPIFDAWRTAFSRRGIRMGHEWYKNGTCFRKIAFPPVPGVSTISGNRGRSGQTSCRVGPIFRVISLFTRSLFVQNQTIHGLSEKPRCRLALLHRTEPPRTFDSASYVDELNNRLLAKKLQFKGHEEEGYKAFVFDPRGVPLYKNLRILSRVAVLFGIHGAGLAHSLFLQEGHSALLELYCADRQAGNGHYKTIVAMMGLSYSSLSSTMCKGFDPGVVAGAAIKLIPETTKADCLP